MHPTSGQQRPCRKVLQDLSLPPEEQPSERKLYLERVLRDRDPVLALEVRNRVKFRCLLKELVDNVGHAFKVSPVFRNLEHI